MEAVGLNLGIAWKALSLDVGLDWSMDQGEGRINGQGFTLSRTTRHIPLTLRAEIPNCRLDPRSLEVLIGCQVLIQARNF